MSDVWADVRPYVYFNATLLWGFALAFCITYRREQKVGGRAGGRACARVRRRGTTPAAAAAPVAAPHPPTPTPSQEHEEFNSPVTSMLSMIEVGMSCCSPGIAYRPPAHLTCLPACLIS